MKRKLIVTLVATALELYAATAAQAGDCLNPATSLANGATPVVTGPLSPVTGFPEFVQETGVNNPVAVQRCLDPVFCFASPVIPSDPFSIQIGSGIEAFYWGANNKATDAAGNTVITYVAAAESAFLQFGPNGEPISGSQFPFLRLRITMGVPVDGIYTVVHPYGIETFNVVGATGHRDVFFTVDKGLNSSSGPAGILGAVGPYLRAVPDGSYDPTKFLGNGGAAAAPTPATGSPCNFNAIQVTGIDTLGNPVDFSGQNETVIFSDLWNIQGQLYDGRLQTSISADRLTYARGATGGGQIDAFGTSTATATMTVVDGPTIPVNTGRIAAPVTLDQTVFNPNAVANPAGTNSASVKIADAAAVPPIVSLSAAERSGVTDPSTLNLPLVDYVDISQADFDPSTNQLTVTAASSDARANPVLTLRDFGSFTAGTPVKLVNTVAPPAVVHVDSAAGGSNSAQVRVVTATLPAAPTALATSAVSSRALTLTWTDNATNESGFNIYSVVGTTRTLLTSVGANVSSVALAGLTPATAYTLQVDAFNGLGATSSATVNVSTLALPVAPAAVSGALAPSPTSRGINVSFTDNSTDETAFQIQRATVVGATVGTFSTVGTLNVAAPASTGAITFTDVSGPPAVSTSYAYRVITVRGPDSSAPSANSLTLTTPASPTANAAPTFGAVTGNSVVLNWARRNTTETGYVVYRATVTGGVVGAFAAVSGATPLGLVTTFTDSTAQPATTYQYRINAVGWANYTTGINGAVSANVTTPSAAGLVAVNNLAATNASRPVLSWTDRSTGESGYQITRTPYSVAGGVFTAGTAQSNTINTANLASFTDNFLPLATLGQLYGYNVAAVSGAQTATASNTAYAVPGLSPTTQPLAGTARNSPISVGWVTSNGALVTGVTVQKCAGNCTAASTWQTLTTSTLANSGATPFVDSAVTRGTTYSYRTVVRTANNPATAQPYVTATSAIVTARAN